MKLILKWRELPPEVRRHLVERLGDRRITEKDLFKLKLWLESSPEIPAGEWYKEFGSFKLAGRGPLALTFLSPDQFGYGTEIIA